MSGLKKDLGKAASMDKSGLIQRWTRPLLTHLYWCATSSAEGNEDLIEAKYCSIMDHIANIHTHDSTLFPKCAHARRKKGQKKKEYFKKGCES